MPIWMAPLVLPPASTRTVISSSSYSSSSASSASSSSVSAACSASHSAFDLRAWPMRKRSVSTIRTTTATTNSVNTTVNTVDEEAKVIVAEATGMILVQRVL